MKQQELVPYSQPNIPFSVMRGPKWQTLAEANRLEKAGKIRVLGNGVLYQEGVRILIALPYEPLTKRTPAQGVTWRYRLLRWGGFAVIGLGTVTALLAALWDARHVIMIGVGLVLLPASLVWIYRLISTGHACKGLHCSRCPSR